MSKSITPPQELFFDRLLSHYQKSYASVKKPYPESWEDCCGLQVGILNKSTPFFINGAIADDLYNISRERNDIDCLSHMPFPILYFELMDPLEMIVGEGYKRSVKGIVMAKEHLLFPGSLSRAFGKDYFNILLYDANTFSERPPHDLPDTAYFESETPYNLGFTSHLFQYLPNQKELRGVETYTLDPRRGLMQNPLSIGEQDRVREHFTKITNFCLNLIDYVNAHNITLKVVSRETREAKDIERINRKREHNGKRPLFALKPFYWVDIIEKTIVRKDSLKKQELENNVGLKNALTYREWVRGHFQRYHTTEGIQKNWINPYVRGPVSAPWKENRYVVLEEMLERGAFPSKE